MSGLLTPTVLRPFVPGDYAGVVEVVNESAPEFPFTARTYEQWDTTRPAYCGFMRLIAEADGQIVGVGQFDQRVDQFHPNRYIMGIHVRPNYQRRGIGSHLYDALITVLHERGAKVVRGFAREDKPSDVRFWQKRGYHEVMRDGGAFLTAADFDPSVWAEDEQRPTRSDGVRLQTFADLPDDPARDRKLHALYNTILADVPPRGERTPLDFDTFLRLRLYRLGFLPDALFVAVDASGAYVGVHQLMVPPSGASDVLAIGLTGVLSSWRRKGIALALKVRGLRYACEKGSIRLVKTGNASDNVPILKLNERLGFVREPWRIHFLKTF